MADQRFRFGAFELDTASGDLRRSGLRVRLSPQPFRLLALLLQHPGEVVSRDVLRRELWGDRGYGDFDRTLGFCVYRLRIALHDDARAPRFIETVAGRGYRFVAPVESLLPVPPPRRRRHFAAAWAAGVALLGLAVAVAQQQSVAPAVSPRAEAAARVALAQQQLDETRLGRVAPRVAYGVAREQALLALAEGERADARLVLAAVRLLNDWDAPGALLEIDRAAAAAPDDSCVAVTRARTLSQLGRHAEAERAIDAAERAHPESPAAAREAVLVRYRARQFAEAERRLDRFRSANDPGLAPGSWIEFLGFKIARHMGTPERTAEAAVRAMRAFGVPAEQQAALVKMPLDERPRAFLLGSVAYLRHAPPEAASPAQVALPYAALGRATEAIDLLEQAVLQRSPLLIESLADPDLDALRADPRFRRLVAPIGLGS